MNDEPQQMLSEETIETIQDLIQANIDSHNGFEYAAAQLDDPVAYELFHRLALERLSNSWELHKLVADNRKTPATQGTVKGGLHRVFMKLRHQLNHDDLVFVTEANRGEAYITAMYESLLKPAAGSAITDLLVDQYNAIKGGHGRLADLRETMERSRIEANQ